MSKGGSRSVIRRSRLRQPDLFLATDSAAHGTESGRDTAHLVSLEKAVGWLRHEATEFFPDGKPPPPIYSIEAVKMLYAMCDCLEQLIEDSPLVEQLAVGGKNVWVMGLVGVRISEPLQIVEFLWTRGDGVTLSSDEDFDLADVFDSPMVFQRIIEAIYPVLLDEGGQSDPTTELALKRWLAGAAETLLKRHPRYRYLVRYEFPKQLQMEHATQLLCQKARTNVHRGTMRASHVRRVFANIGAYRQIERENAVLLPILTAFLEFGQALVEGIDPLFQVKEAMLEAGLSEAAWRYLSRHGWRLFKQPWHLSIDQSVWEIAIRYLKLLEHAGLPAPPPPSLVVPLLSAFNVPAEFGSGVRIREEFPKELQPHVLRAVLLEADRRRNDPSLRNLIPELLGVCWWATQRPQILDANQIRAGWSWLVSQWRAAEVMRCAIEAVKQSSWAATSGGMVIGGWSVEPLNSSEKMVRTAFVLRNCLISRIPYAEAGMEEYFAVRNDSEKVVACIGLSFDQTRKAALIDVRGFANAPVNNEIRWIASYVLNMLRSKAKV